MMTSAQLVETSVSDHYLQNCWNKILLLSPKTVFHSYALHSYSHVWCIIFFQLQDLAVTPNLRDPRLNFAESVIEGHIQDIKTTDRSYLRVVLWFSFLCPMFFGPFLYFWVLQYLKDSTQGTSLSSGSDGNRSRVDYICRRNEEPLICSVTLFCCFLLLIEVIFVLARVWTSTEISKRGNMSRDFIVLLALIPEWLVICCCNCLCCEDLDISSFFSRLLFIMCTSLVSYHLSWVAVGIILYFL